MVLLFVTDWRCLLVCLFAHAVDVSNLLIEMISLVDGLQVMGTVFIVEPHMEFMSAEVLL